MNSPDLSAAKGTQGVTLIELLLVLSIIAVLGTATTPFLSRFVTANNLDTTRDNVIGTIRKAQQYAMDGKNDATWGACVTGTNIRLFQGTCTTPTFSEDFSIPTSVTVSGFAETTFSKRGEPSGAVTITISSATGSHTVSINAAGGITVN